MVNTILTIAVSIIMLSMAIALYRFVKGPNSADRLVAFDVMTISSVAMIGIIAKMAGRIIYLDIALVYALLSFLAVIIIAKYQEKSL